VIRFTDSPYKVDENEGVAMVTICVMSELERAVTVELSFSNGTALSKF
jgi:hypothetical protein